ncbi:MAG: hypothetical protein L3J54_06400, partial [Draconibacterium sp.]|nr:hypothetical protein [Draconibacterium sp.]
ANKMAGTSLDGSKNILWELGIKGTGGNLLFVMAPLHGVITGASYLTQEYIMPSAYTGIEKTVWKRTFGSFYDTHAAKKFESLVSALNDESYSKDFLAKALLMGKFVETAYFGG